jgi:ribosome biogenesis GTPase
MRELSLWADEEELKKSFEDLEELALGCRFSNCDHVKSEGCAVQEALDKGGLSQERFHNYLKLKREAEYLEKTTSRKKGKH